MAPVEPAVVSTAAPAAAVAASEPSVDDAARRELAMMVRVRRALEAAAFLAAHGTDVHAPRVRKILAELR